MYRESPLNIADFKRRDAVQRPAACSIATHKHNIIFWTTIEPCEVTQHGERVPEVLEEVSAFARLRGYTVRSDVCIKCT